MADSRRLRSGSEPITIASLNAALETQSAKLRVEITADIDAKLNDRLAALQAGIIASLQNEISELKKGKDELTEIISSQQRSILALERKARDKNIILLGVPEEPEDSLRPSVVSILEAISSKPMDPVVDNVVRLGKKTPNKLRAIKVSFTNSSARDEILRNSNKLLTNANYKKVSVKMDLCELDRKESKRLYDHFQRKREELKQNGASVELRRGVLTVDGVIIDRRDPLQNFFRR